MNVFPPLEMSRYSDDDPYTYEGSSVLINIPGIKDQKELDSFERRKTMLKMLSDPPQGKFDFNHFRQIHHYLFQDIYEWAGKVRNVPVSKGSHQFATPAYIHEQGDLLFKWLAIENYLTDLIQKEFINKAAHFVLELNVLHPFRDGNGRTIRFFLLLLGENAGYKLEPDVLEQGWMDACVAGFAGEETKMIKLLEEALKS